MAKPVCQLLIFPCFTLVRTPWNIMSCHYVHYVLFISFAISSLEKCLRVSKTESNGLSRICFEMTRQATMPSSSEKCIHVSKTESYGLSRICFEMTRQATMPSSKAWLCLADEQHISLTMKHASLHASRVSSHIKRSIIQRSNFEFWPSNCNRCGILSDFYLIKPLLDLL
jgi:hypothetical protein